MARTMRPASADTVRAWAAETGWTDEFGRGPKERGRLNTQLVADFDKAHKRNWIQYMPGYKDDASADNSRNSGNTRSRSTEVATRDATPEKKEAAKATPARASRTEKAEPIRVEAQRVKGEMAANGSESPASIADVIAMLQSAAQASGGKTKGMLAYYQLVG